jgi:hypothetical protein
VIFLDCGAQQNARVGGQRESFEVKDGNSHLVHFCLGFFHSLRFGFLRIFSKCECVTTPESGSISASGMK